jgi:hypothetical protein
MQSLKKAAVFIVIIGSGVLIGFALKPKHSQKNNAVNTALQNASSETAEVSAKPETRQVNSNNTNSAIIAEPKQQPDNNKNKITSKEDELESYQSTVPENKNSLIEKKKDNEEETESVINQSLPETSVNTASGERNKKSRSNNSANEVSEKSIPVTDDILKFISVKANNYKPGTFGGFHNLELTVTNDSKFTMDNVMVELQYLKLSEQPVKIEHIRFQSIAPGGSLTIRMPDTNRGAKLLYKIIKIEPKDSNTAGL